MQRKASWILSGAAVLAAGMTARAAEPAKPPNFLVIVADDMGYADAGCYGGEIATPNLDRLAAGGLRFSRFYSTARCWPSRTCILTGYYAQQVRMDPPRGRIPAWTRVLPHYLKPAGYRCYTSGKWHLMGAPKAVTDGGFDRAYVLHDHDRYFTPRKHELDDRELPPVPADAPGYVTTMIADRALEFLRQHQGEHAPKPFCLYLAFTSPHFPLQAPAEDVAKYAETYRAGWDAIREKRWRRQKDMGLVDGELPPLEPAIRASWSLPEAELRARIGSGEMGHAEPWAGLNAEQQAFQAAKMAVHAAMVDRMDREIGRVLDQVRAMGAEENTVVFFVSDNGTTAEQIIRGDGHDPAAPPGSAKTFLCLGPGWSSAGNTPFRYHKSWVHEGGISSPLIVRWPAGIPTRGEVRRTTGHFIDLLPTMLELAGAKPDRAWNGREAPPLPGRSLVPAFAADTAIARPYLYFHHMNHRALRVGDWKIVSAGGKDADGAWELYDLAKDRAELHNLAAAQPDRVREMAAQWQKLEDEFRAQAGPAEPAAAKPPAKKAGKAAKPTADS